jgi:diguanylate cyclase (GGDEF)-like protein
MSPAPIITALPSPAARTGSPSRLPQAESTAAFGLRVSRQFAQCRRESGQLALLWIEADAPVPADAERSAAEHDALIQTVSLRLRNRVRGTDEVVYMGGSAFAVLLLAAGAAEARLVEQRLTLALRGTYCVESRLVQLGVRVGTALFPQTGRNGGDLAEAARQNLARPV